MAMEPPVNTGSAGTVPNKGMRRISSADWTSSKQNQGMRRNSSFDWLSSMRSVPLVGPGGCADDNEDASSCLTLEDVDTIKKTQGSRRHTVGLLPELPQPGSGAGTGPSPVIDLGLPGDASDKSAAAGQGQYKPSQSGVWKWLTTTQQPSGAHGRLSEEDDDCVDAPLTAAAAKPLVPDQASSGLTKSLAGGLLGLKKFGFSAREMNVMSPPSGDL